MKLNEKKDLVWFSATVVNTGN